MPVYFFEMPKCLFVKLSSRYGSYYIFKYFFNTKYFKKTNVKKKKKILSSKELYDFKNLDI